MGLFGRDDDEDETLETDPPEPANDGADASTGDGQGATYEELEEAEVSDPDPDADAEATSDGAGDLDVEEALKELSARMAVLSSNLEGVQESRGELEDKLGTVEQRMSRLGSLAEAVSSEYNPFISENAPDEPSWTPELEAAEDRDPVPPSDPSSGDDEADPDRSDDASTAPDPPDEAPDLEAEMPDDGDDVGSNGTGQPEPEPEAPPPGPGVDGAPTDAGPTEMPGTSPAALEPSNGSEDGRRQADHGPEDVRSITHDGAVPDDGLEENLLMLEWVGTMLDRVGRAGLMDLLDYYQNLGWLDQETKERATRVAIGVEAPDRVGEGHWRGDVDLHRCSLIAIQRLQGNQVPAARVDELQLDLRRLFEG